MLPHIAGESTDSADLKQNAQSREQIGRGQKEESTKQRVPTACLPSGLLPLTILSFLICGVCVICGLFSSTCPQLTGLLESAGHF